MQSAFINALGNWNPQLLREFRGRLKSRSVLAAVSLSIIVQVILCLGYLQDDSTILLSKQWLNLWTTLTWIFPYILFTLGSYYIVSDLTQEEKRGTLNFIRLSPRPAEEILVGKLLGVPILPYITVGLGIPLHCIAAFFAGISLQFMISYYLLLIAGCAFCYSVAMLYGLVGSRQKAFISQQATTAVAAAAIAFLLFSPVFMFWNIGVTWTVFPPVAEIFSVNDVRVYWAYSEINQNLMISHGFTLGNIAISIALLWSLLLRRFRQPYSTVISKRQSYLFLGYLEILALGFCLSPKLTINSGDLTGASIVLFAFTVVLLLIITFGVCPQRQALLDWSRYPSKNWLSWVWADKSPALLSMGIHVLMANAILLPWTLIAGVGTQKPIETIIAFIGVSNILLIYGVLIQQIQAANIRNPNIWVVGGLSVWLIVPPTILSLMGLLPKEIPVTTTLWTILGYPFWHFDQPETLIFTVFGILIQWLVLGGLLWQFNQTLEDLQNLQSLHSAE
jgi:hypothetical protein